MRRSDAANDTFVQAPTAFLSKLEGGRTPFLTPAELEQLGFRLAIYGISLMMHAVQAMQRVLTAPPGAVG
jgi:2-methylisocitrate lyase-like PEP mutase family enzyme